jgi:hypothetical protein
MMMNQQQPEININAKSLTDRAMSNPAADKIIAQRTRRALPPSLSSSSSSSPAAMSRQQMQDILYTLIQERCSVKDPKLEAKALETLLYRSTNGDVESYSKIMLDKSVIASKLKEVRTMILIKRLHKKHQKFGGGFRSEMKLTKLPVLPKSQHVSAAKTKDDATSAADDDDSCNHKLPITTKALGSLKISNPPPRHLRDGMDCDGEQEHGHGSSSTKQFAAV